MKQQSAPRVLLATAWRTYHLTLGLVEYANQAGWHLNLTTYISGELPENWEGEGIVTLLGEHKALTNFIESKLQNVPTVSMSINRHGLDIPSVDVDNKEVGKMAAMHFIERDFKNCIFYSYSNWPVSQLRGNTFKKYIEEDEGSCQLLVWDNARGRQKNTWNNRQRWLLKELAKLPKPFAIFAVDDMRAVELIEVCLQLQFKIPEDVAILGVGNSEIFSSSTIIPLTSISIDDHQLGYEAARMLDSLMQGEEPPKKPVFIKPLDIKVRRSTDTIATEHPGIARTIRFILDNYHAAIGIRDIVESSGMSQTLLYELFKKQFDKSPARFLTEIRLKKAKYLLRETDLKISAISTRCGFGDAVNLYRTFQRIERVTPKQFRQTYQK